MLSDSVDVRYVALPGDGGFCAMRMGHRIGEITIVRVGLDKLVIERTVIDAEYDKSEIGTNLVRCVCNMARAQGRKIITLCPFARSILCKYPEFDELRALHTR